METVVNLKEVFKEKGYRYTAQREKIFDILMEQNTEHFTTSDIFELVKAKYPDIGIATIYRTLLIFEKLCIINKLGSNDEFNRYEFNTSADTQEHYHLICIKCGQISDIKDKFMNEMSEKILKQYHFTVKGHSQKIYGICRACFMKELQNAEKLSRTEL